MNATEEDLLINGNPDAPVPEGVFCAKTRQPMTPTPKHAAGVPEGIHLSPAAQKLEDMAQDVDLALGGQERKLQGALSRHFERCLTITSDDTRVRRKPKRM